MLESIPEGCWCDDGRFCPRRTDDCPECPLWTGWVKLAHSVFPQSAIVRYLKKVSLLLIEHPERPPGFCGLMWDRNNLHLT